MQLQAQVVKIESSKKYIDGHRRYTLKFDEADGWDNCITVSEAVFTKRPLPVLDDIITLSFDTSF